MDRNKPKREEVVFAVLLILVAVELHQDKVLNEIAMRENEEKEKMR